MIGRVRTVLSAQRGAKGWHALGRVKRTGKGQAQDLSKSLRSRKLDVTTCLASPEGKTLPILYHDRRLVGPSSSIVPRTRH